MTEEKKKKPDVEASLADLTEEVKRLAESNQALYDQAAARAAPPPTAREFRVAARRKIAAYYDDHKNDQSLPRFRSGPHEEAARRAEEKGADDAAA